MKRSWRVVRYIILLVVLYCFYASVTFSRNQAAFQRFLKSLYITWDDFPPDFAAVLNVSRSDEGPINSYNYSNLPPADPTGHIPPIIHFIWFKNIYEARPAVTEIPAVGSNAPDLCREYNPGYTVNVWNASAARELLEEHYSWFIPTYDAYPHPIQRVDAFKYFVLYHYGGIYSDLDIACRRPMAPLLRYPAWFPEASPLGVNNDLMATRARHPLMKMMMEGLKARNKNLIFPYLTIFWSTGPQYTSDLLKQWFLERQGRLKPVATDKSSSNPDLWYVLPQVFYSEEYTFFGHRPGGTWHGSDVAVVLWLVDRPWVPFSIVVIAIALCVVTSLRRRRLQRTAESAAKFAA